MQMNEMSSAIVKRVTKELVSLRNEPPEGIQIIINDDNICDIQALINGPSGTPYQNGVFRIKLQLTKDYPNTAPMGFFLTKIFHPNVSASGEICVSTLKKDWTPDVGLNQLLLVIKCLLIVPNPESALNEEAGKLLLEDYNAYAKHARLITSIHAFDKKSENVIPSDMEEHLVFSNIGINSGNISPQKRAAPVKTDKKKTLRRL